MPERRGRPPAWVLVAVLALIAVATMVLWPRPQDDPLAPDVTGPSTGAPTAKQDAPGITQGPGEATATTEPDQPGDQTTAPTDEPPTEPPDPADPWGRAHEDARVQAEQVLEGMSLRQKAGQVIVPTYSGTGAPVDLVAEEDFGGVIVMTDNLTTTDDLDSALEQLHTGLAERGRNWPLFIGVDQEGGLVERVKGDLTRWPTFMTYGAADDEDLTRAAAGASGAELVDLGFTVVFAPVADVTTGPQDPTIGSRSIGSSPERVARHALAASRGYLDAGIIPVLKHFPGHGSVTTDSHLELPVQDRSLAELTETDLVPFASAARAGLPAVMVGHLAFTAMGSTGPATLEGAVMTDLLRERVGFEGLVITDAMNMGAVVAQPTAGGRHVAVDALAAGADVILMPTDPVAAREAIIAAVDAGELDQDRLDQAVLAQLQVLLAREGLVSKAGQTLVTGAPGSHQELSQQVTAAALTVVAGPCQGPLVGDVVTVVADEPALGWFVEAAERAGLRVGPGGTMVALRGPGSGGYAADVVVAMDTPYLLGASTMTSGIALYGQTPGAMRALVEVLTGDAQAPGALPVDVPGLSSAGC